MPRKKPPFAAIRADAGIEILELDASDADKALCMQQIGIGNSMSPTLLPGDRLEISKENDNVHLGSVVTFQFGKNFVTHRVIRKKGNLVWVRGDNATGIQGPLKVEQLTAVVVGFHRDSQRCSLDGVRDRWAGLARNYTLSTLRDFAFRFPKVRRFIEIDLLSNGPVRKIKRLITGLLLGSPYISEEFDNAVILANLLSPLWTADEKALRWLERKIIRRQIRVFWARFHSSRYTAGSVVLIEDTLGGTGKIGNVGLLLVKPGFRGAGIGRKLLEELEQSARRNRLEMLWAEVMPDNVRSLDLFRSQGYRRSTDKDFSSWPKTLKSRMLPGRVVMMKPLG